MSLFCQLLYKKGVIELSKANQLKIDYTKITKQTNNLVSNDSRDFRSICKKWGVIPNIALNYCNGENKDEYLLDDLLYKQRYVIERTNAWMDSFRSLLNRFDYTVSSWKSFNYIAFKIILF